MKQHDRKKSQDPKFRAWSRQTIIGHIGGLFIAILFPTVFLTSLSKDLTTNLMIAPLILIGVSLGLFLIKNSSILDFYENHVIVWSLLSRQRIAYENIVDIVYFTTKSSSMLDIYYIQGSRRKKCNVMIGLSGKEAAIMDKILVNDFLVKVVGPSSKFPGRIFGWKIKG